MMVLAALPAACNGFGGNEGGASAPAIGPGSSSLITRHSLGGVELGQSQAAVERLIGSGSTLSIRNSPGKQVVYEVPGGQLTVVYGSLFAGDPPAVLTAFTHSPGFRTAGRVGVGSSLSQVEALGAMNCAPTDVHHEQCQTLAYGPGLEFDLTDGHVKRVALVRRIN